MARIRAITVLRKKGDGADLHFRRYFRTKKEAQAFIAKQTSGRYFMRSEWLDERRFESAPRKKAKRRPARAKPRRASPRAPRGLVDSLLGWLR
jgi:hypothetical protein